MGCTLIFISFIRSYTHERRLGTSSLVAIPLGRQHFLCQRTDRLSFSQTKLHWSSLTCRISSCTKASTVTPKAVLLFVSTSRVFSEIRFTDQRHLLAATVNLINAFRAAKMPVVWTNWGLTEFDCKFCHSRAYVKCSLIPSIY